MSFFKRLFPIAAFLFLLAQPVFAQHKKDGLTWYTDIRQVYELSKKTKKPVFAFFTGSDWCGYCHKLEKAVFIKQGFQAWAKKNVILMEVDFPRKTKLPDTLAAQNDGMQNFFQVQGFPTIWIFDIDKDSTNGKFNIAAIGSLGYPSEATGKEEATFLQNANAVLKNKK